MEAAKLQAMAYGELLKNNPMVPCDTEQILMQVYISIIIYTNVVYEVIIPHAYNYYRLKDIYLN